MTDRPHALIIINPIAGTSGKTGVAAYLTRRMSEAGWNVTVEFTAGRGDATAFAGRAVAGGFDTVIAAGGDGTVNETARALRGTSMPMGIIPLGSGNGLARHLGIPVDVEQAVGIILERHVVDADFGSVNEQPFFCTFGVGFDAAVSETFSRQHRRGRLMYVKSAILEYVKYHPEVYTISANGKILTEKAFLIAVCNASQYGNNAYIAPSASITDGLLDITIVHAGSPLDTAFVGLDLFTGAINSNTMIRTFRAPAAVIYRTGDGPAHIDGEPVTMPSTMAVKCHHNALRLLAPVRAVEFRPVITPMENMIRDLTTAFHRLIHPTV
ncbi:MAG: diacylglycerol kinase family lipid kinase [Pseudoflavonifractor sp.]|nr:diacylglycerol kinase family lipid kinase [Pseudoflavonifractor sp.]